MKLTDPRILRLIALFKFAKALLFIVIGVGALKLIHSDLTDFLVHAARRFGLDPGGHFVGIAIQKAANLTPDRVRGIGMASFVYAALFLTEGIGLWMMKHWAEWLTVILTSSLIPLEVYEFFKHPSWGKVLIFLLNLAIVAYLIYIIRAQRAHKLHGD